MEKENVYIDENDLNDELEKARKIFKKIIDNQEKPVRKNKNFDIVKNLKDEIFEMLKLGYSVHYIFNILKKEKIFNSSYTSFNIYIKRIKKTDDKV